MPLGYQLVGDAGIAGEPFLVTRSKRSRRTLDQTRVLQGTQELGGGRCSTNGHTTQKAQNCSRSPRVHKAERCSLKARKFWGESTNWAVCTTSVSSAVASLAIVERHSLDIGCNPPRWRHSPHKNASLALAML